jgi:cob(I)alamin adenosyltransferase
MVRINKIYTKTGDDGTTALADGSRLSKASHRVSAYGDVDELNSYLGLIRTMVAANWPDLSVNLEKIQNELFDIGSNLATREGAATYPVFQVTDSHLQHLETLIDGITEKLPPLTSFVIPGGTILNGHLHITRAICRRAERSIVKLSQSEPVNNNIIIYLNRLSDYLFALCRADSTRSGVAETLWIPDHKRTVK